jgi:preprotein translocase subunit YajC
MFKRRIAGFLSLFVFCVLAALPMLMAMASQPNTDPNAPPPPAWVSFVPILAMVVIFYFFLIRPQSRQRQDRQKLMESLKKGDRVVTQGGFIVQVVNITGNIIEVKINDDTRAKIQRSAVVTVLTDQAEAALVGANGAQQ